MVGKIRRLEISLAVKCQILFGAAVVLIIAAALLVPWRRMEQLTAQLDERSAAALADEVLARHADDASLAIPPTTKPAALLAPDDADEDTADDETEAAGRAEAADRAERRLAARQPASRLVAHGSRADVTRFERKALNHFSRHREGGPLVNYYERGNNTDGYRYARPLYLAGACVRCHG